MALPTYEQLMAQPAPDSGAMPSYDELMGNSAPKQSLSDRAAADTSGNSKFYPDTNISKPAMAATSFVEGLTGQSAPEAAQSGLRQALKDRSISYEQFQQMQGQVSKEQSSGTSFSQQLETVKAENPTIAGTSKIAGEITNAVATQPAADLVMGTVFKNGADVLRGAGKYFSESSIPGLKKYLNKIGGAEGLNKLADTLDKYNIMDTPSATLGSLDSKLEGATTAVGSELENSWKALDESTNAAIAGSKASDTVFENWRSTYKMTNGIEPPKSAQKLALETINDYIEPNQLYSHTDLASIATDLQRQAWKKPVINAAQNDVQVGFAFRRGNLELAADSGADDALLQRVADASSEYNKLRTVSSAVKAKLSKGQNSIAVASEMLRHGAAMSMGAPVKAADIAYSLGKTTLAKTTAAATAKIGSRILSSAADMGPWQRIMLNIAAKKGLNGLHDWHVHQMLNSDAYAKAYGEATQPSLLDK